MATKTQTVEQQYFSTLNELLSDATPVGAYCLAFAEVYRRQTGSAPSRQFMERLVQCETVQEGIRLAEDWGVDFGG